MNNIKKLSELIHKTTGIVKTRSKTNRNLSEKWAATVDKDILKHTDIKGIDKGILYVIVDSATWLHYIVAFKKEELLLSIQNAYKQGFISDIRFYIGH
jgi:predicted nucleic acid-binding Zn ribbon protein